MTSASLPAEAPPQPGTLGIPWRVIVAGALLALPALPLLVLHGRQLWLREHYQFFPLALVGAGVLVAQRLHGLGSLTPGNRWVCYATLAVGWLGLAVAGLLMSPWLGTIVTLFLFLAVAYGLGGGQLLHCVLPAWLFLWLIVPPPMNLDKQLVTKLQSRTARWSSRVLDQVSVYHVMHGNVVSVPQKQLMVEEACSGINSLFAMLACTFFFVLWARRPIIRAVLLVLAAVGWVLLANVLRVVTIAFAHTRWGFNLAEGWPHEVLGAFLFALMLGMIWSTDRLLEALNPLAWFRHTDPLRRPARTGPSASPGPTRFPEVRRMPPLAWPVAGAFALLGAVQLALLWPETAGAHFTFGPLVARFEHLGADALPQQWHQWQRQQFETVRRSRDDQNGEFSQVWRYRWGRHNAIVSLDFVFNGWHELTGCYSTTGWVLERRTPPTAEEKESRPFVDAQLRKPLDTFGYLVFSLLDEQDRPLHPHEGKALQGQVSDRLAALRGLRRLRGETASEALSLPTYQVQVLVESHAPLLPEEQLEVQVFFRHVLALLRRPGTPAP